MIHEDGRRKYERSRRVSDEVSLSSGSIDYDLARRFHKDLKRSNDRDLP